MIPATLLLARPQPGASIQSCSVEEQAMRSAGLSVSPFAANDRLCDLAQITSLLKNGDKNSTSYTRLLGIPEIMHIVRLAHSKQFVDISMLWFWIHSFNHTDWGLPGYYCAPWRCSCEQSSRSPVLMELMFSWGRRYLSRNDLDKENQASRPGMWFAVSYWLDVSSTCKVIPSAVESYLSLEQGSQTHWSPEPHDALKNCWGSQRAFAFMGVSADIFHVKS